MVLLVFRSIQLLNGFDKTAVFVSMFFEVTKDMIPFLFMIGESPQEFLIQCFSWLLKQPGVCSACSHLRCGQCCDAKSYLSNQSDGDS